MSEAAPRFLPQISAPYTLVVDKLNHYGIGTEFVNVNPNDLNPMQPFVFSDNIKEYKPEKTDYIWISKNNDIIDGHNRFVSALMKNMPIKAIKIDSNGNDCVRYLNKIQDIYDYENQSNLEEVVSQEDINQENDQDAGFSEEEYLNSLMEDNEKLKVDGNQINLIGYRKDPIREDSIIGNFFVLEPVKEFKKYSIDFENMLDTDDLGIKFDNRQLPIEILSKIWFPDVNFEKLSKKHNISPTNMKNIMIAERAKKMGYDGIKYGDKLLQGLK